MVVAGRLEHQHQALGHLAGEVVLPGPELALELIAPGPERIGPGVDRVLPGADAVDGELPRPADAVQVCVDPTQLGLEPATLPLGAVSRDDSQELMAIAEHVGLHGDDITDTALHGIASAIDRRRGILDDDPPWRRFDLRWSHASNISTALDWVNTAP